MFFNMAEEFQKYKNILDWEWEEFKRQLEREVSASWFFQIDSEKQGFKLNRVGIFVTNFVKLLFNFSSKFMV